MTHNDTSEEQILEAAIEEWARRKRDDSQKMTNAQAAAMLKEMLGTPGGARKITLTVFLASTVVLLTAVGAFVGHKAMRPAPSGPVATAGFRGMGVRSSGMRTVMM